MVSERPKWTTDTSCIVSGRPKWTIDIRNDVSRTVNCVFKTSIQARAQQNLRYDIYVRAKLPLVGCVEA